MVRAEVWGPIAPVIHTCNHTTSPPTHGMQYRPTHIHIGHQPLAPQPEEVTQDGEDHEPQNRPEPHPGFEALSCGWVCVVRIKDLGLCHIIEWMRWVSSGCFTHPSLRALRPAHGHDHALPCAAAGST